jgi:hypothetical protein
MFTLFVRCLRVEIRAPLRLTVFSVCRGIYLRDLVYIETGTIEEQDAADHKNIIQFRQKKKVFGVIHFLQSFQTTSYSFAVQDELVEYLENMPTLTEEQMFELSQKREPKGAKRSSVL